jgi:hypothetical protein
MISFNFSRLFFGALLPQIFVLGTLPVFIAGTLSLADFYRL